MNKFTWTENPVTFTDTLNNAWQNVWSGTEIWTVCLERCFVLTEFINSNIATPKWNVNLFSWKRGNIMLRTTQYRFHVCKILVSLLNYLPVSPLRLYLVILHMLSQLLFMTLAPTLILQLLDPTTSFTPLFPSLVVFSHFPLLVWFATLT